MLSLLRALLCCALLCPVSPVPCSVPPVPRTPCPATALFMETMKVLRNLSSQGSSGTMALNNVLEAGGDAATHLQGFIEALENSKRSEEQRHLIRNLKKIQTYSETCTGWKAALKEHHWKALEEYDFFSNLGYLLRFLSHNALPDKTQ